MATEVKNLSPYYKDIPWVSPITQLTCTSYKLQITVWKGLKTSVPIVPHFEITKNNAEGLATGNDEVNVSRLTRDFIDFTAITNSGATQLLPSTNQAWIKTVVFYTTSDATELTIPQVLDVQLMTKGYGYGTEGRNPRFSTQDILMPINEYNVDKNLGRFTVPILLDDQSSGLMANNDTFTFFFQETLMDVLVNDNLGWQPTNIVLLIFAPDYDPTEFTLSIENNLIKFTDVTLPLGINFLLRSEELDNAVWVDSTQMTVTANSVLAPNETTTAEKIDYVDNGSGGTVAQNVTVVDITLHQISIWMRGDVGGEKVRINLKNTSSVGTDGTDRVLTTEWFRYTEGLASTGTARGFEIECFAADGGSRTFFTWGAQLENATFKENYVKTLGTAVTTPASVDFFRRDFVYQIVDSINSATTGANVTMNIHKLPIILLAVDDIYNVNDTDVVNLTVLDNDSLGTTPTDITIVDDTGLSSGSLAIDGTSQFLIFTPNGVVPPSSETFTYTIEDDTLATSQATGTLFVESKEGGGGDASVNMSVTAQATGALSCLDDLDVIRFHNGVSALPSTGDIIFTDEAQTTTFNGSDLFYKIPDGRSIQVDSFGEVTTLFVCGEGEA